MQTCVFITFRVCNVGFAVKTVTRIAGLRERRPVLSTALSHQTASVRVGSRVGQGEGKAT